MIDVELRPLFWDIDTATFEPREYPDNTIFRILEYGDKTAVAWMRRNFSDENIRTVLRNERRLTRKSGNFRALAYDVPLDNVAALRQANLTQSR